MKTIFVFITLLLFSAISVAENVCEPYKPGKYEPVELVIKEEAYSYKNALEALTILGHVTIRPPQELKGSEEYISTANAEIVLKGHILRSNCLLTKDKKACEVFCSHMKQRPMWYD